MKDWEELYKHSSGFINYQEDYPKGEKQQDSRGIIVKQKFKEEVTTRKLISKGIGQKGQEEICKEWQQNTNQEPKEPDPGEEEKEVQLHLKVQHSGHNVHKGVHHKFQQEYSQKEKKMLETSSRMNKNQEEAKIKESQTSRSIKQPKQRWTYGTTVGSSNYKQNTHEQKGQDKVKLRKVLIATSNTDRGKASWAELEGGQTKREHQVLIRRIIGSSNTRTADTFPSVQRLSLKKDERWRRETHINLANRAKCPSRDITGFSPKNRTGPMGRGSKKTSAKNLALESNQARAETDPGDREGEHSRSSNKREGRLWKIDEKKMDRKGKKTKADEGMTTARVSAEA
ncbi:hypothetical protein PPACK8108_LOCUS19095 [Phakopsora pachyrhizi]|uniref:Uncharacterized protein n=1 Tax=Phakopsora pachyrhizi TaxID=170000 RepID=A0AAV0BGP8_PHAPC|nr:hypothetical protein PPACK8108_LOCUS19095 [Phakopsora pachyrhizi]